MLLSSNSVSPNQTFVQISWCRSEGFQTFGAIGVFLCSLQMPKFRADTVSLRRSASPEAGVPVQAAPGLAHPQGAQVSPISPARSPQRPLQHARLATGAAAPHEEDATSRTGATPPERPSTSSPLDGGHSELPQERESSSGGAAEAPAASESGGRRNGGRGMQLPVAAASRQASGGREPAVGLSGGAGRHAGRKSLGDALRRPAEAEGSPRGSGPGLGPGSGLGPVSELGLGSGSGLGPKKRTPPIVARPRKSAESGAAGTEGVKLAFGRRIEPPEGDPRTRKSTPPAEHLGAGPQSRPMPDKHVSHPGVQRGQQGSGRGSGKDGAPSGGTVRIGRQVAARTDSGQVRVGVGSERAPLVTLATSNTGAVPEVQARKAAAKGTGGQHAQRVAGPRLMHAAVGFTPAPQSVANDASRRRERQPAQVGAKTRGSGMSRLIVSCIHGWNACPLMRTEESKTPRRETKKELELSNSRSK